jgi:hypothetical protein
MLWDKLIHHYTYQAERAGATGGGGGRGGEDEEINVRFGDRVIGLTESMNLGTIAFQAVGKALFLSTQGTAALRATLISFSKSMAEANNLQKQVLTTNRTIGSVVKGNTKALADFPGKLTDAIEVQFRFLEAGVLGAAQGSLKLGTTMKSLGLDVGKLVQANKAALTWGRMTPGSLDRLNATLLDTTTESGVSMNRLVDSMNKLSATLKVTGALGVTGDVLKTQMQLIGRIGAGSDDLVTQMLSKAFDTNTTMASEAMLGIFDQMQQFRATPTAEGGMSLIETAADRFEAINKSLEGVPLQMRAAILEPWGGFEGFGSLAAMIVEMRDNMSNLDRRLASTTEQYRATMDEFRNQVWKPLQITFMATFRPLIKILTFIAPMLGRLFQAYIVLKTISILTNKFRQRLVDNMRRLSLAISKNTLAQRAGKAGGLGGVFAGMGPWGIVASLAVTMVSMAAINTAIGDDLSEINRKTPEPITAASIFAERTARMIKDTVATTIFAGNEVLASINTGTEESNELLAKLMQYFLDHGETGTVMTR